MDTAQSVTFVGDVFWFETGAPILYGELDLGVFFGQRDLDFVRMAVAAGVGEGLLDDTEEGCFQRRRQPFAVELVFEDDFR